ncbi:hypothetical protein Q3G72_000173 [Acer saccharum]|nr:hypothetical protein Q3G72_000173 [Acer saccharum]
MMVILILRSPGESIEIELASNIAASQLVVPPRILSMRRHHSEQNHKPSSNLRYPTLRNVQNHPELKYSQKVASHVQL